MTYEHELSVTLDGVKYDIFCGYSCFESDLEDFELVAAFLSGEEDPIKDEDLLRELAHAAEEEFYANPPESTLDDPMTLAKSALEDSL